MNALISPHRVSRRTILKGDALTVSFALARMRTDAFAQGAVMAPRLVDPQEVDSFLAVNGDGTVTVFCGKVDLGQGMRIAIRQIVADELAINVDKINYVEGDTALTPDQRANLRLNWHPARGNADSTSRGNRAQGALRACRPTAQCEGRGFSSQQTAR